MNKKDNDRQIRAIKTRILKNSHNGIINPALQKQLGRQLKALTESNQQLNELHRFDKPGIEEQDPSMYGAPSDVGQESSGDGYKWIKIIRNELGIAPKGMAEENVIIDLDEPVGKLFQVTPLRKYGATSNPGINIHFDDGETGMAIGVNRHSSVSEVLAATYKKYPETFKRVAEQLIASSGDEYEGM